MNLLLIEPHEIVGSSVEAGGRVYLQGRRAEHLRKVLRVDPGKILRAGVVGAGSGEARVVDVADERIELELGPLGPTPPPSGVELAVGLPRPQGLHRVLQTVAAMGVDRLHLVNAWRVEKSYFSSPSLRAETMRGHLLLGAEQGMTTRLPGIEVHPRLLPFLEAWDDASRPAGAAHRPAQRLLAHPGAPPLEQRLDVTEGAEVKVAIGPEGGWIDREVESFAAAGFEAFSLGPWVLRVEVAVSALLAQLELLRRLGAQREVAPSRATLAAGTSSR